MTKTIVIIGGGPGGYVAAIKAAMLGAKVTLIEKSDLGGTCLNKGCIPTKALYENAEMLHAINNSENFGITVHKYNIDIAKINERKNNIINKLTTGIRTILESYQVNIVNGIGSLVDKNTVKVVSDNTTELLSADYIIIATGSSPIMPPIKGSDNANVITSEEALRFENIPENMVIIGGGVIGMEFANIYNSFGSKVTVIEAMKNILGKMDLTVTKRYQAIAKKLGITIYNATKAKEIIAENDGVRVLVEGKKGEKSIIANKVLMSVGRKPIVENLNLEDLGINFDSRGIKVDQNYRTNIDNIYAIGDVNGQSMLAHAASHQGILAVEHIMTDKHSSSFPVVPSCIFVSPEISSVGLTEEEVKEQGIDYAVSKIMFGSNGKALTLGKEEGFIKIIADKQTKTILGVHILGPHASDLIHEGVLAVQNRLNVSQIKHTIHAHPTLSETFYEAVLGLDNEAIHKVKSLR